MDTDAIQQRLDDGAAVLDDAYEDIVDVALPTGHRLEGREEIDLDELADDPWIAWPDGGFCHEDGTISKRFVKMLHDVSFDRDFMTEQWNTPSVATEARGMLVSKDWRDLTWFTELRMSS